MLVKRRILICIVTGAASGIGKEIARKILDFVDVLICIDSNESELKKSIQEFNKNKNKEIIDIVCDVSIYEQVEDVLKKIVSKTGIYPNIIINNAGYGGPFQKIPDISEDVFARVLHTNLMSVHYFSKLLLPDMQHNKFGRFINISSVQGLFGAAFSAAYVASKHALIGYTKSIACEWGEYNITANAICPGYVNTKMGVQENKRPCHLESVLAKTPLKRIAETSEIADLVNFLISPGANFINGATITIDGGLSCHLGT